MESKKPRKRKVDGKLESILEPHGPSKLQVKIEPEMEMPDPAQAAELAKQAPARKRWKWSRNVTDYEEIEQIGEGAYGQVWMGRDKVSGEVVALKKVRMDQEKEGFPVTAIRELKMLRSLRHENIVQLKEIVTGQNQTTTAAMRNRHEIYMVFEYVDNDINGFVESPTIKFTEPQVKTYARQLLAGLWYCHEREVLHRDIKGSNLLVDNNGNLKIADFGLARTFNDGLDRYTNRVITLWYRAPELLLGTEQYGPEVDMWSVGCLFYELLCKKTLFSGATEPEQMDLIFRTLGSPTEESWPNWEKLPLAEMVPKGKYPCIIGRKLAHLSKPAFDLIRKLISLNPAERPTASEALDHEWFWCEPYPTPRDQMPKYRSTHEWQVRQQKRQKC